MKRIMSADIQQAIEFYKSGNYAMVLSRLSPIVKTMKSVEPHISLILAQSCFKLDQFGQAAQWFDKAALPNVQNREQIQLLAANLYTRVKNWTRAMELTRDIVRANPKNLEALALHRVCLRTLLLIDAADASNRDVRRRMLANEPGIFAMEKPLDHLFWSADEALASRLTRMDGGSPPLAENRALRHSRPHRYGEKIRVAYLSNDLSDRHATMRLLQGVLLTHDPEQFEIYTVCYTNEGMRGIDRGMRARLPNLCHIGSSKDGEVIEMMRDTQIDILVDLKGHTKDARLDILNLGAAPIQVAWLGFPGITTQMDCDYAIGDAVVTPEASAPYWNTQFCRLPETYQPNDDTHRALPPAATRAELNLPEDKVILASFNSVLKISPDTFRLWMEILRQAPDTILWMLCELPDARQNFLAAVRKAGVDPARIIFAEIADYPDHVARLQAADMALDTFPCNGHTTTSDKLWAGLPIATMKGTSFASRVSESLLRALGLPELVADDEASYVVLSVRLATEKAYRASLRDKIVAHRFTAPLFDTERFTRHLETAYRMMVDKARAGEAPAAFDVPALPARTQPFKH